MFDPDENDPGSFRATNWTGAAQLALGAVGPQSFLPGLSTGILFRFLMALATYIQHLSCEESCILNTNQY